MFHVLIYFTVMRSGFYHLNVLQFKLLILCETIYNYLRICLFVCMCVLVYEYVCAYVCIYRNLYSSITLYKTNHCNDVTRNKFIAIQFRSFPHLCPSSSPPPPSAPPHSAPPPPRPSGTPAPPRDPLRDAPSPPCPPRRGHSLGMALGGREGRNQPQLTKKINHNQPKSTVLSKKLINQKSNLATKKKINCYLSKSTQCNQNQL